MEEWYPTSIKLVAVLVGGKSVFYKYPGGTLPISIWLIVECWGGGNISNGWVDEWGGTQPVSNWLLVRCVCGRGGTLPISNWFLVGWREVIYQYPTSCWLGEGSLLISNCLVVK